MGEFFLSLGAKLLLGAKFLLKLGAAGFDWLVAKPIRGVLLVFVLFVAAHQFVIDPHIRREALADGKAEQAKADAEKFAAQLAQAHADGLAWREKATAEGQKIAQLDREKNDAEIRAHAAAADALLVRGPGAAASRCRPGDPAALPAGAGGHDGAAAAGTAARPDVPEGDWATVPWAWLVTVVREHDDLRSEALTWRTDHAQQSAAWQRLTEPAK